MSKLISKIVVPDSNEATGYSLYNVKDSGAIHSSDVGVAGGVASLDNAGKVPSSQLPSYVDDVVEGYYHENKFYTTYTPGQEEGDPGTYSGEITAETGKIYVDIPTNQSYRWSGSAYIVISSPYVLPTASANTLGGVKVGNNLSIDQNGVLSAAAAANEVQIGGETPSSSSDVEIFIDTTEDAIAEVYTKQQQDGKFIVIKDLNAAPTESTLTYTENGTVKNFKQGDEVRVPDAEADNGYTFYKLYELTTSGNTTTATWDKLGAGGASGPTTDSLTIQLAQVGGNTTDLIDATITIKDGNNTTLYTFTWAGSPIQVSISDVVSYTVSVSVITGYITPASQSYVLNGESKNVKLSYIKNIGVYIEDTEHNLYTSSTWDSSKTPNAVCIFTTAYKFRMAVFDTVPHLPYSNALYADATNYIPTETNSTTAGNNFNGKYNTGKIVEFCTAHNINNSSYAGPYCNNYVFPDGETTGYMWAPGQFFIFNSNKTSVNTCLSVIGKAQLDVSSGNYWTSLLYDEDSPWYGIPSNGTISASSARKMTSNVPYVIPIADYE